MIIIDVDSLASGVFSKAAVSKMVAKSLKQAKTKAGEPIYIPTRPIYWMSKKPITMNDIEDLGLPRVGHALGVKSVVEALKQMIAKVDDVASSYGMQKTGAFRRQVFVITDRDFSDIEKMKATPVPVSLFAGPGRV